MSRLADVLAVDGAGFADQTGQWLAFGGKSALPLLPRLGEEPLQTLESDGAHILAARVASYRGGNDSWLTLWTRAKAPRSVLLGKADRLESLAAQLSLARVRRGAAAYRQMLQRAAKTARLGFWACDLPGEEIEWSEGVYELFGIPAGSVVSRHDILGMYTPSSRQEMQKQRAAAIASGGSMSVDAEITNVRGERRWIRITGTVDVENGKPTRIFGIKQDITEERLLAQETRRLANTDPMTGLANRSQFQSRLEGEVGALLLIDLDGFKGINDTLGHAAGDACLIETARRMAECCAEGDLLARIGGDEFALVVDGARKHLARTLANEIVIALRTPHRFGDTERFVTASVGIAYGHVCNGDNLYAEADGALYAAKREGRNTWREQKYR